MIPRFAMSLPDHYIELSRKNGIWIEKDRCFIGKLNPHICKPETHKTNEHRGEDGKAQVFLGRAE